MSNNESKIKHTNIIQYAILNIYKEKMRNVRIDSEKVKTKIIRLLYLLNNLRNTREIDKPVSELIEATLRIKQTPISEKQLNINIPHAYAVAISTLYIASKR